MKEVFGDLWEFDGIIAITTNGFVKRDRTCVMGRGCARQAAVRFPELPRKLASRISTEGNHVFYFPEYRLITFPVKHNWWEAADLGLIERSARELLKIIEVKKIKEAIYLPRPGCGNGRLKWEDVKKILSPILKSDPFHIVTYSRTDSWRRISSLQSLGPTQETACGLKVGGPHPQRGVGVYPPSTLPLPAFLERPKKGPQKMEPRKNPGVIFVCPYCGNATRKVPICGVSSRNGGVMYPVGLCINCGPLNLELLALCREAAVGAYRN